MQFIVLQKEHPRDEGCELGGAKILIPREHGLQLHDARGHDVSSGFSDAVKAVSALHTCLIVPDKRHVTGQH